MINFHRIGKMSLPRGASKQVILSKSVPWLSSTGVDCNYENPLIDYVKESLGIYREDHNDSVMYFRNVQEHDDSYFDKCDGYAAAFLHVVVAGKFTLQVGKCSYQLSRGDVFVMNPKALHSVSTKSKMCATVVLTVTMKDWANKEMNYGNV